jgi:hypothetical protein
MGKYTSLLLLLAILLFVSCSKKEGKEPKNSPLTEQVRVQVAYDADEIAFRFVWKTQSKTRPAGMPNTGQKYPGQFHDFLRFNGTTFDRIASAERIQEDRVSFTITPFGDSPEFFEALNCAASCHEGMARHNLLTEDIVDHWHWRGGRGGSMGYAEDAAINSKERIRDAVGTPPSAFLRSGGDRFREDQPRFTGTGHAVLEFGFPRFVYNKGKVMPGNYTIPRFFASDESNAIITDPYVQAARVRDVTINRSLLVAHQDLNFDATDKVNALDVGYLVFVATGSAAHLPAHLRTTDSAQHTYWLSYWASQSGIAASNATAAANKLNEIVAEWEGANRNAMVTHSIGFIYNSDSHNIRSEREFDANRNEWTVTMYRKLSTGSAFDADLADIRLGKRYSFAYAMHDIGAAGISHNISLPLVISNTTQTDIKATSVSDVETVEWDRISYFDSNYVKAEYVNEWKWTHGWLTGSSHAGAGMVTSSSCTSCHGSKLQYTTVQ